MRLNREDYVVAGVMPADFRLLGFTPQLWTPLTLGAADHAPDARKNRYLYLFARLAPGVTLEQAQAQMQVIAQQAQGDFPATEKRWGASVRMLPGFPDSQFWHSHCAGVDYDGGGICTADRLRKRCGSVADSRGEPAEGTGDAYVARGESRARGAATVDGRSGDCADGRRLLACCLTYIGIRVVRAGLSFNPEISAVPVVSTETCCCLRRGSRLCRRSFRAWRPRLRRVEQRSTQT